MKFPPEPNETERTGFVRAALYEAARYESETAVPEDLVARALAQHGRSGNRCAQPRLVPGLVASACGLVLLVGGGLWLRRSHRLFAGPPLPGPITAFHPAQKPVLPNATAPMRFDFGPPPLPPIDTTKFLVSTGRFHHRHRVAHRAMRSQHRSSLARNSPLPIQANGSTGVWTTETVHCEVVTQTLTPVWVAHADPETAAIVLTPALFQLSLQPDNDADPTAAQIGVALIPVSFEQENTHP